VQQRDPRVVEEAEKDAARRDVSAELGGLHAEPAWPVVGEVLDRPHDVERPGHHPLAGVVAPGDQRDEDPQRDDAGE
jgi:hypothetical protein